MVGFVSLVLGLGPRLMVVRPYLARVRTRVFALLRSAGLDPADALRVEMGPPDDEAIAAIIEADPDVLLVPFHAHRDAEGNRLDGLTLCGRLHETAGASLAPVLMPITPMASASLRLMAGSGERAALFTELLERRILVLPEDEVDEHETIPQVMAFLRRHGIRLGAS